MEAGAPGLNFSFATRVVVMDTSIGIENVTALHLMPMEKTVLGLRLMLRVVAIQIPAEVLLFLLLRIDNPI